MRTKRDTFAVAAMKQRLVLLVVVLLVLLVQLVVVYVVVLGACREDATS